MLSDTQLQDMVHEIARTQAQLYYKEEEQDSRPISRAVFRLTLEIVGIQLTRAGLTDDQMSTLRWVPQVIVDEMEAVGWSFV